jgi:hypothetical protein
MSILITPFQKLLKDQSIKASDLANKIDKDRSTVTKWKNPQRFPEPQCSAQIIRAVEELGYTIDHNDLYQASVKVA